MHCFFCICFLLSFIPLLNHYGSKLGELIFPVIQNQNGTSFFKELITGSILAIAITHMIRLSMLIINGFWICIMYCMSISFCWIDYQWLINDGFLSNHYQDLSQ